MMILEDYLEELSVFSFGIVAVIIAYIYFRFNYGLKRKKTIEHTPRLKNE